MLINDIYGWARIQPHKTAVIYDDKPLDYATFARAIEVTRLFLDRQQLPRGKTAVIAVSSLLDSWVINIACRPTGMNTIAASSIRDAEELRSRDVALLVTTEFDAKQYIFDGSAFAGTKTVVIPTAIYAGTRQGDLPSPLVGNAPGGGQILRTSGTTGSYKALMLEGEQEDRLIAARARTHGSRSWDHTPPDRSGSLDGFPQKRSPAVWHVGGSVVIDQRKGLGKRFFDHSPNRCLLIPPLFNQLMTWQVTHNRQVNCKIEVGGGLPQVAVAKMALEICNEVSIEYSASELGIVPMYCDIDNEQNVFWFYAANDRTVEIVDEAFVECSIAQEGMLRIRLGELDCSSYIDDQDATSKAFFDGYFYPGDMAVKRADGRIRILGRVGDTINLQGHKVAVAPIEQSLQRYLQVTEVCLFSHVNDDGQDELIVAIQSNSAPSQAKLEQVRREFYYFERVRFPVLKAFPRTKTGFQKVRRIALRELVRRKR